MAREMGARLLMVALLATLGVPVVQSCDSGSAGDAVVAGSVPGEFALLGAQRPRLDLQPLRVRHRLR
jgi:hypothetical protein